jgi:CelD/BcsL family acetyltransferase involved in cellulose biosynthesis
LTAFRDAAPAADVVLPAAAARREAGRHAPHDLNLRIHGDLANVEAEWRRFEAVADCTVFQTFDWLAAWHRHIGLRARVQPAVAIGRFANGDTAFMVPLCVTPRGPARRLCWLGQELCDYNAPLLARDFSERVTAERFLEIWRELRLRLQQDPLFRHDWIDLEKMPQTLGAQRNPFTYLDVSPNASGAHLTQLGGDWEEFYTAKRSSATRRRDRAKRRHMSEHGDVQFATAAEAADARRTLEILMEQKSRALVRKGVADMFARPGCRGRGSSFMSRACRSAPMRWRPISASCSAAATITCWRAIAKTAAPPTSGRARCICASFSNTRSSAACSASTSPSATSATSWNGATAA